jgi:hypothetical protein
MTKRPAPTGDGKSASRSGGLIFREFWNAWIQGKKSHEDGEPIIKVKVVAVHTDGRVEIEGRDMQLTLGYHVPDHLRSALCFRGRAEWSARRYR